MYGFNRKTIRFLLLSLLTVFIIAIAAFVVSLIALNAGRNPIESSVPDLSENSATSEYSSVVINNTDNTSSESALPNDNNFVELPVLSTEVKLFTDYRAYNLWYTPHYRLQQCAWTDSQGLRRYGEDYIAALGSFYSTSIGDRFKVTLDSGNSFTIIMGDGKADCDCDSRHMYTPCVNYDGDNAANVIEFIIDKDVISDAVYDYGSLEILDDFKGNIISMEYLGRDESQDWDTYETE